MDVPIRIRSWRKVKDLTQTELAEAAGVTVSAVSYWEAGKTSPKQEHLESVVEALGLTMAQFYGPIPKQRAA